MARLLLLLGGGTAISFANPIPDAPVIAWDEVTTDSTPNFDITWTSGSPDTWRNAAADDVLHGEVQLNQTGDYVTYLDYTLLADDITAGTVNVADADPVEDGTHNFRFRMERTGVGNSAYSNIEAVTIAAVRDFALPGLYLNSASARAFALPGAYVVENV